MKKVAKRLVVRAAKRAERGEALGYLIGKLLEVEHAEWHYQNEVIPALRHAAEQRGQDRHSIMSTLEAGDLSGILRLARAFQCAEPCADYFGAEPCVRCVDEEIPF